MVNKVNVSQLIKLFSKHALDELSNDLKDLKKYATKIKKIEDSIKEYNENFDSNVDTKSILEDGAWYINERIGLNNYIFHGISSEWDEELVIELIKIIGINDVNYLDDFYGTYLIYAINEGYSNLAKYLLDNFDDIDVNIPNEDLRTPLHIACFNGNIEIIKVLLSNISIKPNELDNEGNSPILERPKLKCDDEMNELFDKEEFNEYYLSLNGNYNNLIFPIHLQVLLVLANDERIDINIKDNDGCGILDNIIPSYNDDLCYDLFLAIGILKNTNRFNINNVGFGYGEKNPILIKIMELWEGCYSFDFTMENEEGTNMCKTIINKLLDDDTLNLNLENDKGETFLFKYLDFLNYHIHDFDVEIFRKAIFHKNIDLNKNVKVKDDDGDIIENNYINEVFPIRSGYGETTRHDLFSTIQFYTKEDEYIIDLRMQLLSLILSIPNIELNVNIKCFDDYNDAYYMPLIHQFIAHGTIDSIRLLLNNYNLNINIQDENGDTPLMRAISTKHIPLINLLLSRNDLDFSIKNKLNQSIDDICSYEILGLIKKHNNYEDKGIIDDIFTYMKLHGDIAGIVIFILIVIVIAIFK